MGKINNRFPEYFAAYKERIGKSQVQIAVAWDINPVTISRYLNGQMNSISLDLLERMCNDMGVRPGDILDWEENSGE